jgi:hypothetical protein
LQAKETGVRSDTTAQRLFASLLWKIRNQKEIQVSEKRKEPKSGGSDALADIPAKIEL